MLDYKEYNQSISDRFGVCLMKFANRFEVIRERTNINLKAFYTNKLSENYRYHRSILYQQFDIDGLAVEAIQRKNEEAKYVLIQLHGGAYVLGFNDTYRKVAQKYLSLVHQLKVFSLRYSLAPKHPFPTALHESVKLYQYILNQGFAPENIIIAGDSAGGGLTIATALYLRDHQLPLPKAIVTMSAWTNLAMDGESHQTNKHCDPMFGVGSIPLDVKAYTNGQDVRHPYISPKYANFHDFPEMLMFVGGNELIESDTMDVAEKAQHHTKVTVRKHLGMFHVYPLGFNKMKSSREAWRIIEKYLNDQLRGEKNGAF